MTKKNVQMLLVAGAVLAAPIAVRAQLVPVEGDLGVYDPVNNVTWTSNANLMATQAANYTNGVCGAAGSTACENAFVSLVIADSGGVIYDLPNYSDNSLPYSGSYTLSAVIDFTPSMGSMSWWGAQAWVHYLNVISYGGSNQWALPTTIDSDASSGYPDGHAGDPPQSSSQLAELFYGGLGQVTYNWITNEHNVSYGLFSNVQAYNYWSATQHSANPSYAWNFNTAGGSQSDSTPKADNFYVLAEYPGQLGSSTRSTGGSNSDGPIPLWALVALGGVFPHHWVASFQDSRLAAPSGCACIR